MIRRRSDGVFEVRVDAHRYIRGWSSTPDEMREILRRFGVGDSVLAAPGAVSETVAAAEFEAVIDGALDHDSDALRRYVQQAATHPTRIQLHRALFDLRPQIPDSDDGIRLWLQQRADALQTAAPQVTHLDAFSGSGRLVPHRRPADYDAFGECAEWVEPRLIVHTPDPRWGEFDRRPEILVVITRALRDADTPEALDRWIDTFTHARAAAGHIQLVRVEGPAGPLFRLRTNGSHRVHLARMLGLPYLLARVTTSRLTCPLFVPDLDIPDHPLVRLNGLWRGLRRRGLLEVDDDWTPTRLCAEWMLMPPEHAVMVNRACATAYPGVLERVSGMSAAELFDAGRWTRALRPPASRRWPRLLRWSRATRQGQLQPPASWGRPDSPL